MNKATSKEMMEREFDILQQIQALKLPPSVYNKILSRIAEKDLTISWKWVASAAAVFAILLALELISINQSNEAPTTEVETLVQNENYQLYE